MRELLRTFRQLLRLDEAVARLPVHEARVAQQRLVEAEQRLDTADLELAERAQHATPRRLAVAVAHDQLRDHRVVQAADLRPGRDAGVDAHAGPRRLPVARDPPGAREEAVGRVLRVDAALDRMTAELDVLLAQP